ncbi:MAG: DUF3393 domain-containing protein [Candidatus Marinimicrobia bacterium]|jgi:membrane-bound lytic murein transglycosylase C|nr:DUF3393 domain-containing protein [Candidatus Neomarinimicrobiota bacterium]
MQYRIISVTIASLLVIILPVMAQDDFEKWVQQQNLSFSEMISEQNQSLDSVTQEFDRYEEDQNQQFEDFQAAIEQKWEVFKSSSPQKMVSYDDDLNSRSSVDFEKGEIEVEVIIEDTPGKTSQQSQEEGEIALEKKLQKVITLPAPDNQPILKDQIADGEGGSISPKTSKVFAKKVVATEAVQKSNITAKDGKPRVKYSVTIKMVPNHIEIRAKRFKANILKQSKRFKIDPAIVFAIIHTESSFNPKARSHVPAYGLMQLVPKSGARDAYSYIYKRDKLLSAQYLYIPVNNIELGCAYISKLRHVYFGGIKNDESAYYCTIAGYNTGPGNVAKTMSGTTKLIANANAVNGKTPEQIFKILSNKLPYVETRKYLVKVLERSNYYRSWLKM